MAKGVTAMTHSPARVRITQGRDHHCRVVFTRKALRPNQVLPTTGGRRFFFRRPVNDLDLVGTIHNMVVGYDEAPPSTASSGPT